MYLVQVPQQNIERVEVRIEQVLTIHPQLGTVAEKLESGGHERVALDKLPDVAQPGQDGVQPTTRAQDGGHLVVLLFVCVLVFAVVQLLNHVLRGVAEETTHAVDHTHCVRVLLEREGGRKEEIWKTQRRHSIYREKTQYM